MSKKHYIQIAAAFKQNIERLIDTRDNSESTAERIQAEAGRSSLERLAFDFCNIASGDNPNFDRSRFLSACGL